jgi:sensor domain CHASE-containing protein
MNARKIETEFTTQNLVATSLPIEATTGIPKKRLRAIVGRWFQRPEMTFEQWEKLERKYSPHSSHHAQIYYRDRGL